MKLHHRPRCQRQSLFHHGAFWACGACSYAITQKALMVDEARAKSGSMATLDASL
jgi:hypothetical protein